jgi:hypothetical protein
LGSIGGLARLKSTKTVSSSGLSTFMNMAGLDIIENFNAIAKTMSIVTAVVCFLSTQNMGS